MDFILRQYNGRGGRSVYHEQVVGEMHPLYRMTAACILPDDSQCKFSGFGFDTGDILYAGFVFGNPFAHQQSFLYY